MSKEANEQLGESRERVEQFGHRRGCPPVSPPNELTAGGQPGGGLTEHSAVVVTDRVAALPAWAAQWVARVAQ